MKSRLLFLGLFLASITGFSQSWAPVGAAWYYTENFFMSPNIDYLKIESVKDTTIQGIVCKKLVKRHLLVCTDRPVEEYMYNNGQKVYFYDTIFHTFQQLYDFTPVVGNSWYFRVKNYQTPGDEDTLYVKVDSVTTVSINGSVKNKLYVRYDFHNEMIPGSSYNGVLIESVGDLMYMFNYYPTFGFVCDGNMSQGLRCYEDPVLGLWQTGIADSCTYVYTGIDNLMQSLVTIQPNPAHDVVTINLPSEIRSTEFTLFSLQGKQVMKGIMTGGKNTINVTGLPAGIYVFQINSGTTIVTCKLITL
jgi:hypothetical protein